MITLAEVALAFFCAVWLGVLIAATVIGSAFESFVPSGWRVEPTLAQRVGNVAVFVVPSVVLVLIAWHLFL